MQGSTDATLAAKSTEYTPGSAQSDAGRQSLVSEFIDAALTAGVQRPAEGLSQIADQVLGTNIAANVHLIKPLDPAEFGSARWHAQQIGAGVGMLLPFLAVSKLTKGATGSLAGETEGASQVVRSAASGFVYDSLLTPGSANGTNFWLERAKNGLVGSATFATLTASSLKLKEATLLVKELSPTASGIFAGTASGIPAGLVSAEASSFLSTGKHASAKDMGQSVYGMAVVGGGLGAIHSASMEAQAKGTTLVDTIYETARTKGIKWGQSIANSMDALIPQTSFGPQLGFEGANSLRLMSSDSAIGSSATLDPTRLERKGDSTSSKSRKSNSRSTDSDAELSKETKTESTQKGPKGQDKSDEKLRTQSPDLDDRTKTLAKEIETKFNSPVISEAQLLSIVDSLPERDRALAIQILEKSLPNSSEVLFAERMKSLRHNIEAATGGVSTPYVAEGQASWGRALSYLYKKLSLQENRINPGDAVKVGGNSESAIVLDDPNTTRYSPEQQAAFKKFKRVYVVDLGGFETGLNFFDYALGPAAVAKKLTGLVAECNRLAGQHKSLAQGEVVDLALRGDATPNARINANTIVVRPDEAQAIEMSKQIANKASDQTSPKTPQKSASAETSAGDDADMRESLSRINAVVNERKATPEKISDFLMKFVPSNREAVAYVIAKGAINITYSDMFDLSRQVHEKLVSEAKTKGISEKNLVFHDADDGDSVNVINYMHRLANNVPKEQFLTHNEIADLASADALSNRAIVLLDDASYTGSKLDHRITSMSTNATKAGAMMTGTLTRYYVPCFNKDTQDLGVRHVTGRAEAQFRPEKWDGATQKQVDKAFQLATDSGFYVGIYNDPRMDFMGPISSADSTLLWPFGIPDNNVSVLRRFGRDVLGLRQVIDAEPFPLPEKFKDVETNNSFSWTSANQLQSGKLKRGSLTGTHTFDATINQPAQSVRVSAYVHTVDGEQYEYGQRYGQQYKALSTMRKELGLSSENPPLVNRQYTDRGRKVNVWVHEVGVGDDLMEGLTKASDGKTVAPINKSFSRNGDDVPKILHDKPEIRLQLEKALLERLIFTPEDRRPTTRVITNPDGSIRVINQAIDYADGNRKPSWKNIDYRLIREFKASELTPSSFQTLKTFYNSHGTIEGLTKLTQGAFRDSTVEYMLTRIEWLLENKRFPGSSENDNAIY